MNVQIIKMICFLMSKLKQKVTIIACKLFTLKNVPPCLSGGFV